jgi:hypothetical protein
MSLNDIDLPFVLLVGYGVAWMLVAGWLWWRERRRK